MKEWWQVYYFDEAKDKIISFGFSSQDGYIMDHPEYYWKNKTLKTYKLTLLQLNSIQVVKIC